MCLICYLKFDKDTIYVSFITPRHYVEGDGYFEYLDKFRIVFQKSYSKLQNKYGKIIFPDNNKNSIYTFDEFKDNSGKIRFQDISFFIYNKEIWQAYIECMLGFSN